MRYAPSLAGTPGVLWISRPNNLDLVETHRAPRARTCSRGWHVVYDAEALFALRTIAERALRGEMVSEFQQRRLLRQELRAGRDRRCDRRGHAIGSAGHRVDTWPSPCGSCPCRAELRLTVARLAGSPASALHRPGVRSRESQWRRLAHFVATAMPAHRRERRAPARGRAAARCRGLARSRLAGRPTSISSVRSTTSSRCTTTALAFVVPTCATAPGFPTKVVSTPRSADCPSIATPFAGGPATRLARGDELLRRPRPRRAGCARCGALAGES